MSLHALNVKKRLVLLTVLTSVENFAVRFVKKDIGDIERRKRLDNDDFWAAKRNSGT